MVKRRGEKRVQVWCTSSSHLWNLGMPLRGDTPLSPQKQQSNTKRLVKGNFHACCHGNQRWPEKGCHHGHHQKIGFAHGDLLYHKTNNIILLLSTHMVLIYNCELGIINSSEFFHSKKLWKKGYVLPSISILILSEVWWGVTT